MSDDHADAVGDDRASAGAGAHRAGSANVLPLAAAGVTMILWASAFIGIRAVGVHYTPGAMASGRLIVGVLALTLAGAFRSRRRHPTKSLAALTTPRGPRRHPTKSLATLTTPRGPRRLPRGRALLLIIGFGVLWFGVYTVLVNAAERHLDAGTAALLINVGPVLIAVLAGLFLGEGFPRTLVVGLAIAFVGVVTIAVGTSSGRRDAAGALLALGAAALYAVGVLLQKQALRYVDPFTATWLGCAAGAVVCLPFVPALGAEVGAAPLAATAGIVYLGVFPTAIAFATWSYALAHTSAGRLSSSSYLVPAIAVLMSWLLLAETPVPLAFLGGALCLAGVAVTRLPARPRGRERVPPPSGTSPAGPVSDAVAISSRHPSS